MLPCINVRSKASQVDRPGGDAHLIFVSSKLCQLSRLGQFCQLKDMIDFIE
jgi:hypothetical protein